MQWEPIQIIASVLFTTLFWVVVLILTRIRLTKARQTAEDVVADAEKEARNRAEQTERESRESVEQYRAEAEKDVLKQRKEQQSAESRLARREDNLDRKFDLLNQKENHLENKEKSLNQRGSLMEQREQELEQVIEEEKQNLFRITKLSRDEAEKMLLQKMERDFEHEEETLIARMTERIRETSERRSREILATCIQRMASSYCQEITTSTIQIPNDEMKGRVIGREGRNIRAFEKATGVDVIVDDTPGVIIVSCFDSIRREMARRAMDQLIADGRIHPARIEEIVEQTKREMNDLIQKEGKQAVYDLDIPGIQPKMITLLGRLKFRSSYGQNVLHHVKECAHLAGMVAAEMGLDVSMAKRAALLHDIGKAVDHEIEGGHPEIGANIARRYDEPAEVVNAIASHHNDVPQESIYAVITQAVDSISGSRPGARGETLERYIKRLEKLEAVVLGFQGVKAANAIQAGREIRVFVNSQKISDNKAIKLCRDIAKDIEEQLTYPGEIKVTLLRETRVVEYAR
ncbi:MAG: ribonuclease Y [Planctomycetota bacterium]|nr:ribonuclease Y [Acidobacteriota bacterium]MCZ6793442.1 ribonuclease Y [Planctomycetota bacterium]